MTFFNAPVQALINIIGRTSDFSVIVDQTNLTDRYDFTIRRLEIPRDRPIEDLQPTDLWDIRATGLELKPIELPSQNLVIDHIERPSPN